MPIISLICLIIFLAFFISGFRKNADFLSPARVFGMLWSFIFGLVELKLSRLQIQWSLFDWFIVLLGLVTFLIGTYVSYIINLNKPFLNVSEIREKIRKNGINEKYLFRFIIFYFLLYLLCYIAEWQILGYIPFFTSRPDRARIEFGVFGLHLIVNGVNVVLFLVVQYFIFIKKNIQKKIIIALIFLISLGSFFLLMQRYNFFILLMMVFCLTYYSGKKVKFRTYLIFGSIVIGLVVGIQSLRITELLSAYILLESKMKISARYSEFAVPYMYVAMNTENFIKYYSHIEKHSLGFFTFDFLAALVGIKHFIAEYFNFYKFKLHIGGYNTFPFYWPYYYDFGITGLAIIPFLIGYTISEIYYFLHRHPNIIVLTLYSVAFAIIVISYSSDPLTRLDMMFNFFIIIFTQVFLLKNFKS